MQQQYNHKNARSWDSIRRFLAIHYKFNTRLDTPFWQACRADVDLGGAADLVQFYRENRPSVLWRPTLLDPLDQFGMEGYLSMLVGQQVPYQKTYMPSEADRANWLKIRQAVQNKVARAYSVPDALRILRTPGCVWPPGLYLPPARAKR